MQKAPETAAASVLRGVCATARIASFALMRHERVRRGGSLGASARVRLLLGSALAVAMLVGAACAPDDELLTPRPTVPTVTTAPQAPATVEDPGPNPEPADPPPSGDRASDGATVDRASAATGEPTATESTAPETASTSPAPEQTESASAAPSTADPVPSTTSIRPGGNMFAADVDLQPVMQLEEPIDMAVAPGDDLVWLAERAGRVLRVDLERGEVIETILDITAETQAVGERGLLGIAATDRWLFVNFTDLDGHTRVDAFERSGTGLGSFRRTILFQAQPYRNHNGGDLAIGPDGLLYVALGDGGSGGDPLDAGQDPTTWLGAVLRIEPTPDADEPYRVPGGNPFAAGDGLDPEGRPEIFLTGVRNPWRFSFDRATGDLWIADVGQDRYEEVTVLLAANGGGAGANLGWRLREGLHSYAGDKPPGNADPVWEYGSEDGCSVTGGYVYRGAAIEDLYGAYVFGDYCTSRLWAVQISSGVVEFRDLGAEVPDGALAAFGEDAQGELYTLSLNGTVARVVPR